MNKLSWKPTWIVNQKISFLFGSWIDDAGLVYQLKWEGDESDAMPRWQWLPKDEGWTHVDCFADHSPEQLLDCGYCGHYEEEDHVFRVVVGCAFHHSWSGHSYLNEIRPLIIEAL